MKKTGVGKRFPVTCGKAMSLGLIGLILRFIVLSGAVVFSFALLFYGFYVVYREHRLIDNFDKLEKYLKLSSEVGLQADAAKGTLSMNRATPGVLLTVIGAIILIVCVFQKYDYSGKSSDGSSTPVIEGVSDGKFEESMSKALRDIDSRLRKLEGASSKGASRDQSTLGAGDLNVIPASWTVQRSSKSQVTPKKPKPTAVSTRGSATKADALLDKWLLSARDIAGLDTTKQIDLLLRRHGQIAIGFDRVLIDRPTTVEEEAAVEYGHRRFAPLLRAFNPTLPRDSSQIPRYTFVRIYYPKGRTTPPRVEEFSLKISGMSRAQVYDRVQAIVEGILNSEEYKTDPPKWWSKRFPDLGAVEFARSLQRETGRQWGTRLIEAEEGETPQDLAKVQFGARKYLPILQFLNYQNPALFSDPKAPLPKGTSFVTIHLNEF